MPVTGCCHPVTPASPQGQPIAKCTGPGWATPPCSRARRRAVSPTTRSAPSPLRHRHPAPDPAPRSITDTSLHNRHPAPQTTSPEPPPPTKRQNLHPAPEIPGATSIFWRTVLAGVSPMTLSGAQCWPASVRRPFPEHSAGQDRPHDTFRSEVTAEPWNDGRRRSDPPPERPTEEDSATGLPHRSRGGPGMRISPAARQAPSPPAMKSASYPLSRIGWTRWPDRRPMSHTRMKCGSGSARGSSP